MEPEYIYSIDGEDFDEWDTITDMVDSDNEPGVKVVIFRGKPIQVKHIDHVLPVIDTIIENIQQHAYDEDGDYAENYLTDLSDPKAIELANVIAEYLNEEIIQPLYHRVGEVEEITITSRGCD